MMRTVHIPRRFVTEAWGGTESVIAETCKRLPDHAFDCEIFCPAALSTPGKDVVAGVPVRRFPYFYPYWGLSADAKAALDRKGGNLFSFALLRALWQEHPLDLIHLHTAKRPGGIGRVVARHRKIPYVISVHGGMIDVPTEEAATWTAPTKGSFEWGKVLGMMVGARRVLDDASAIICVDCSEAAKMRERFPDKRVEFLPNGVDPIPFASGNGTRFRQEHGLHEQQRIILNVGRIDPQKNQLLAVNALDRLRSKGEDAKLVLIGFVTNETYHTKLKAEIRNRGLEDHVILIPGLPPGSHTLFDAYAAADVFLLSSVHEPFGIVILEAWAAGIPVVAAAVGGVPAFTHDGEDVLRFASNDDATAAVHIATILEQPGLGRHLVEQAGRLVREQYHWDTITARLAGIYRDVIAERRLPS